MFIKNALSPAEVSDVIILDEAKRSALVVVAEPQFSLAIGKQGLNVRLANRLADWSIDVKTDEQFAEMDLSAGSRKAANDLFSDSDNFEEITAVADLPGITAALVEILKNSKIEQIEDLLALSGEELAALEGMTPENYDLLGLLMKDSLEIVDEQIDGDADAASTEAEPEEAGSELSGEAEEAEVYECPECSAHITIDMTTCPNCGIGLSFEFEDEE